MVNKKNEHISILDGIRTIAVLSVVFMHWKMFFGFKIDGLFTVFNPLVACGFLGVELFFFLSGIVIVLPFVRAHFNNTSYPNLKLFFKHRIIKIMPSLLLCLFVLVIINYNHNITFKDILFHLLFINEMFQETTRTITDGLWTLAIEVKFYIAFVFMVIPFLKKPFHFILFIFIVANIWRFWALSCGNGDIIIREQQFPGVLDYFSFGMLTGYLYFYFKQFDGKKYFTTIFTSIAIISLSLYYWLVYNLFIRDDYSSYQYNWLINYGTISCILYLGITLGLMFSWKPLQSLFGNPITKFISLISYNLYLWHSVVIQIFMYYQLQNKFLFSLDGTQQQIALMLISVIVSILITYFFEIPIAKRLTLKC